MTNRITETNTVEVNSLVMIKRDQHYVFLYRDEQRKEVCASMGRMAADPELDFSWYDASICQQRVRTEGNK